MELEAEILTASKESAAEGKDASVLFPSNLKDQARAPQTNDTTVLSCGVLLLSISSRVSDTTQHDALFVYAGRRSGLEARGADFCSGRRVSWGV